MNIAGGFAFEVLTLASTFKFKFKTYEDKNSTFYTDDYGAFIMFKSPYARPGC